MDEEQDKIYIWHHLMSLLVLSAALLSLYYALDILLAPEPVYEMNLFLLDGFFGLLR